MQYLQQFETQPLNNLRTHEIQEIGVRLKFEKDAKRLGRIRDYAFLGFLEYL